MNTQTTAENINKKVGKINRMSQAISPDLVNLPTITADTLSTQETPIVATTPRPNTEAVGFQGQLETRAKNKNDAFTQNLQTKAEESRNIKEDSLDELMRSLEGTKGETQLTAEAEEERDVPEIEKELNDINQELLEEQVGLQRKIEAIEKNPTGMLQGALNDEMERARRESLRKQADLTVIQMGIQGRYDSAKAIADRSVAVQLEQQRNKNEALRLQYDEYKDLFDEDEQRAFEAAQGDRERALDQEEESLTRIYDLAVTAMENGAPQSVVRGVLNSKTVDAALSAVGVYGSDQDDGDDDTTGIISFDEFVDEFMGTDKGLALAQEIASDGKQTRNIPEDELRSLMSEQLRDLYDETRRSLIEQGEGSDYDKARMIIDEADTKDWYELRARLLEDTSLSATEVDTILRAQGVKKPASENTSDSTMTDEEFLEEINKE